MVNRGSIWSIGNLSLHRLTKTPLLGTFTPLKPVCPVRDFRQFAGAYVAAVKTQRNYLMRYILRPALYLSLLAVAACDEIAVAGDPVALADVRGQKSCVSAVAKESGNKAAVINTTIPIIETGRYIVDVPNAKSWTCVTDANGRATQIVEQQTG